MLGCVLMFSDNVRYYVFQSAVIFGALSVALVVGSVVSDSIIIVAALGPRAFILFITPRNATATPRHLLGGHSLGLLVGSTFAIVSEGEMAESFIGAYPYFLGIIAAASVTLNILLMGLTRTEHAPATATTLVVIVNGFSWSLVLFVGASIGVLCGVHQLLKSRMRNLI